MAEALFAHQLQAVGARTRVASAGVHALVGHPADPTAVAVCAERGIDLTAHRGRQLTPELARGFELILVMETVHQRAVEQLDPTARGKVHRIGRFGSFEVPDPFRREREAFEEAFVLIEKGLTSFRDAFWTKRR